MVAPCFVLRIAGTVLKGVARVCPSIRQYKAKIQEWGGMEKYVKARDMQILLAKRDRRARDRGVGTAFVFNDVDLEEDRINLFGKRRLGKPGDYVSPSTSMYTSWLNCSN